MSVLDTFFTLFKSSGVEDVEKDNDRFRKSNDKVDSSLDDSRKASDNLARSFKSLGGELLGIAATGLSAAGFLEKLKSATSYSINLDQAARSLRVNISDLDAWGGVVEKNGGTVQTFEASLKNLAMHLGTTGDVALKTLPQFADSFEKLGRYGSFKYGAAIGMDESLILTLQKGRREVEALVEQQKRLGVVTQKDADVARTFNYAWQNAGRSIRTVFVETATAVLPYLEKMLNGFAEGGVYLQAHKDAIVGALMAIGAAALYAATGLVTLRRAEMALKTVGIGLLISGAGIAYEDIKAYREGKNSATGRFRKWFSGAVKQYDEDRIKKGLKPIHPAPEAEMPSGGNTSNLTIDPNDLENLLPKAKAALGITTSVALPSSSVLNSRSMSNRSISISIGDINIQAHTNDVQSLTKAIDDTLKEQLRQALYNFDDGVLA